LGTNFKNFSEKEKDVILNYFKWVIFNQKINTNTISDHLRYYSELKKYGENVKLTSTTVEDFIKEHADWAVTLSEYNDGYHIRGYNNEFHKIVEQPILDDNGLAYYPVLLINTESYINESFIQHNCVRTYIDYPNSVIISLRENDRMSDTRYTLEYSVRYFYTINKFVLTRVQSSGKFNEIITDANVNSVLDVLDRRINNAIKNIEIDMSIKTTYKNGKSITCTLLPDCYGNVVWISTKAFGEEKKDNKVEFAQ
jgi:hypothetical protein